MCWVDDRELMKAMRDWQKAVMAGFDEFDSTGKISEETTQHMDVTKKHYQKEFERFYDAIRLTKDSNKFQENIKLPKPPTAKNIVGSKLTGELGGDFNMKGE